MENQEEQKQEVAQEIDYKAEFEKQQLVIKKLSDNNNNLLTEKQKEAEKRRQAESVAEQERLEKAKRDGDYESVIKSSQEAAKQWQAEFEKLQGTIAQKEVRQAALKYANELGPLDGDAAETLADYIEKRLKYNNGNLVMLDAQGNASVMDSEQLKNEFKSANKFKPLLVGSKASGGGAPGARDSVANEKTVARSTFDTWDAGKQMSFVKSGGRTVD